MDIKPRITLDNSGLRLRPRSYLDSHIPNRVVAKMVNDVRTPLAPAKQVTTLQINRTQRPTGEQLSVITPRIQTAVSNARSVEPISTQYIAHTARKMLDMQSPVTTALRSAAESSSSTGTIGELIESIQRSGTIVAAPAFYDTSKNITSKKDEEDLSSFMPKIKHRLDAIRYSWTRRSMLASAMALVLMVGGLVALFSSIRSNQLVTTQVQALSEKSEHASDSAEGQSSSVEVPSEDKVPDAVIGSYSVAQDLPRYISIPKIHITKTRVLRMGLDKDGAIKTPRNVWDTGWYEGSSKPGEDTGAALIMGHVSGPTDGGIFYNLYRLINGDEISVTQGDGKVLTYKVVAKEEVPASDMNMNNYLISKNVDKPGLTLMTCAGEFNPKTQTFDKRLAVFAIRTN